MQQGFIFMQPFKNHISVHKTGEHTCQQCKKTFLLKSTLTNHLCVDSNNTGMCTRYTKRFYSRAKFLKHVETCSMDSNGDGALSSNTDIMEQ